MSGRRIITISTGALIVIFLIIQLLPTQVNQGKIIKARDITSVYQVPENVQKALKRSCYDCHSNQTEYPWFACIQPVRCMMDRHVSQGKEELNFNEFAMYSSRKKAHRLEAIATSLKEGSMPLSSYLVMHRSAALTSRDKAEILAWIKAVKASN